MIDLPIYGVFSNQLQNEIRTHPETVIKVVPVTETILESGRLTQDCPMYNNLNQDKPVFEVFLAHDCNDKDGMTSFGLISPVCLGCGKQLCNSTAFSLKGRMMFAHYRSQEPVVGYFVDFKI